MFEQVIALLEADSFLAIDYLDQQYDPLEVSKTYNQLVKHFYYEEKDIQSVIALARAGAQYSLAASRMAGMTDPALANELKQSARAALYNLASYTWPGWDEPEIELGEFEVAQGLDAAKATLRLAHELDLPPLRISRSLWMLGALLLASGDLAEARKQFSEASTLAKKAKQPGEGLLCDGFGALISLIVSPDDQNAQAQLNEIKDQLSSLEDGQFFIQQIDTAFEVFAR